MQYNAVVSAERRKKGSGGDSKFLSPEHSRTIKPGEFNKYHPAKLKDLGQDDLIELLSSMEAELQAKDLLLKAILSSQPGQALPLSHLLNDGFLVEDDDEGNNFKNKASSMIQQEDEEEDVWLGEPCAHLNHVIAYHQVVREQMQGIVTSLEKQHKHVVLQLDDERHKRQVDTAQGDDVTYMLEKQREMLEHQMNLEQAKCTRLENERDSLLHVIERERGEQYNTFNNLINDCKAFALQLVQQSARYQKDVEKEKQKNKLLSELMVEETLKFKEKLKQCEDQVNEFRLLEQKKMDVEQKLDVMEKKYRQTFHQLDEERLANRKLTLYINQLQKHLPPDFKQMNDSGEDILYIQDEVEILFKEAGISSITTEVGSRADERHSPELSNIPPTIPRVQPVKMATVLKSSCVKQHSSNAVASSQTSPKPITKPPLSPRVLSPHLSSTSSTSSPGIPSYSKRHSYEDRKVFDFSCDDERSPTLMRNSCENLSHVSPSNMGHVGGGDVVRTSNKSVKTHQCSTATMRHNSCEEVRNIGVGAAALTVELKRNSYDGESSMKKNLPPAPPPRRGSTLSSSGNEKPPIAKVPSQPKKTVLTPTLDILQQAKPSGATSGTNTPGPKL